MCQTSGTSDVSSDQRSTTKALKVGKYILLRTIGKGSSCEVKLGENTRTGEHVAVKVMDKRWIWRNSMGAAVTREINLMQGLQHPNVVSLKEVMNSRTHVYMVLEMVKGKELYDEIVALGKIPEPRARNFLLQILDGLEYLHERGVAHRDLKPENLLLAEDGTIKITDFGLSAAVGGAAQTHRRQRTICGTPYYTAPEVFAHGGKGYDGRQADVWSTGVVLYTMLAGYLPFEGADINTTLDKIEQDQVEFPSWFTAEVRSLLTGMLIKDPVQRYTILQTRAHAWCANSRQAPQLPLHEAPATTPVTPVEVHAQQIVQP